MLLVRARLCDGCRCCCCTGDDATASVNWRDDVKGKKRSAHDQLASLDLAQLADVDGAVLLLAAWWRSTSAEVADFPSEVICCNSDTVRLGLNPTLAQVVIALAPHN
jgi:hypothetical protein